MPDLNETAAAVIRAYGESEPTGEMVEVTSAMLQALSGTFEPANDPTIALDACRRCHCPTLNRPREVGSGFLSMKCTNCSYINVVRA